MAAQTRIEKEYSARPDTRGHTRDCATCFARQDKNKETRRKNKNKRRKKKENRKSEKKEAEKEEKDQKQSRKKGYNTD